MISELHARVFCPKEVAEQRMGVCRDCENFGKTVPKVCDVCSCFMPAKVMLRKYACPVGKWAAEPVRLPAERRSFRREASGGDVES
jgi:hypothetical protein